MLRHLGIAAWRAVAANRLLGAIGLIGLIVGLTAAILMAVLARDALRMNAFVPAADRTYLAASVLSGPGMPDNVNPASNGMAAPLLAANLGEIERFARIAEAEVSIRVGAAARHETLYWADPATAEVLPLPAVAGDFAATLARADGIALTQATARRLFGSETVLGRTLDVDGQPLTIGAVLRDLPPGASDLGHGIFASARNARSAQAKLAAEPGAFSIDARSYVRLREGASPDAVEARMPAFVDRLLPPPMRGAYRMHLIRIDGLALDRGLAPGARDRLAIGTLVAALVLAIATANYVNLASARALRRRREIGIRKAAGASRAQIAAQFLGESVLTVMIAALLALAASEWLLAPLNAFLDTDAAIDHARDPALLLMILAGCGLLGVVAGAYPALIVSGLPPSSILRGGPIAAGRGGRVRSALVTLQFAILIALLIATAIVHQQRRFAMGEALRADIDGVVTVKAACPDAFVTETARLPGVRAVSCSGDELLTGQVFAFIASKGQRISTDIVAALPSLFALYGIRPVAGTLAGLPPRGEGEVRRIVINETAVRRFGFASPAAAIGGIIPVPPDRAGPDQRAAIVAVVPDFALTSVAVPIRPTLYLDRVTGGSGAGLVSIRLDGRRVPETLAAIDATWARTGQTEPIDRAFVSTHIESLYRTLARGIQLFALFAALAILLACAGMIGVAIATADRRTKEIGIRKAMGASTAQVLALLLGELARPVLWASVIAWPVSWWVLGRWLDGYASHVAVSAWVFVGAGATALVVALASVGGQSWLVARRPPVTALRYE